MKTYSIAFDGHSLTRTKKGRRSPESHSIDWTDVQKVIAFKQDLLTIDRVCLYFDRGDGVGVQVDEDMDGWHELLEALPNHLPGCMPASEWHPIVALPAFAENETVIFQRQQ